MVWLTFIILIIIVTQLGLIISSIRHQTAMIRAASDLNLEAHARLYGQVEAAENHLSKMPKMRQPWEP